MATEPDLYLSPVNTPLSLHLNPRWIQEQFLVFPHHHWYPLSTLGALKDTEYTLGTPYTVGTI